MLDSLWKSKIEVFQVEGDLSWLWHVATGGRSYLISLTLCVETVARPIAFWKPWCAFLSYCVRGLAWDQPSKHMSQLYRLEFNRISHGSFNGFTASNPSRLCWEVGRQSLVALIFQLNFELMVCWRTIALQYWFLDSNRRFLEASDELLSLLCLDYCRSSRVGGKVW